MRKYAHSTEFTIKLAKHGTNKSTLATIPMVIVVIFAISFILRPIAAKIAPLNYLQIKVLSALGFLDDYTFRYLVTLIVCIAIIVALNIWSYKVVKKTNITIANIESQYLEYNETRMCGTACYNPEIPDSAKFFDIQIANISKIEIVQPSIKDKIYWNLIIYTPNETYRLCLTDPNAIASDLNSLSPNLFV